MTATLEHLTGRTLPHLAESIDLDASGTFSDTLLVTITTRGRDAGPTVIDTGIACDRIGHTDFRGEVLAPGTGRTSALLRHTLTVGGTRLLTAVFLHSGRIKAVYAPGATVHAFASATDHLDWVLATLDSRTERLAAA